MEGREREGAILRGEGGKGEEKEDRNRAHGRQER